jgi:magnesium chelatase family protein
MSDHVSPELDMATVRGQEYIKRAMEVAASGGHHILLSGPPGGDKALLARCMPSILPPLSSEESLEVTKIYSVSGILPTDHPLILQRPFRAPHHRISQADFVGGGRIPRPGEMSLAHRGVLFLEELSVWRQGVLQVLWQSLEDRIVIISREQGTLMYPAHFLFIASIRPCPCGFFSDPVKECTCTAPAIARYQKRISSPLLDRIDIHIEVPHVDYEKLAEKRNVETSHTIRKRVQMARERQLQRFAGTKLTCNAEMGPSEVHDFCMVEPSAEQVFKAAMQQLHVSTGVVHRVVRLARTIADLAQSDVISANHVAEAMWYRPRVGR